MVAASVLFLFGTQSYTWYTHVPRLGVRLPSARTCVNVASIFVVAEVRAVARVVRHQLGFGRNLKRERGLSVLLHWLVITSCVHDIRVWVHRLRLFVPECVRTLLHLPMRCICSESRVAGVESSASPVGMEFDSRVRMLAWGCFWGNPGGLPHSPPPGSERGGAR